MKVETTNTFPLYDDHDIPDEYRGEMEPDGSMSTLLAESGYSQKAIDYYLHKPHLGIILDADSVTEYTGTCGDSLVLYLSISDGMILDAKFQVTGCAGALTAAMATVDLIKGKTVAFAASIDDGMVFRLLEQVPVAKHECIQLAVKTARKALDSKNVTKENETHTYE